MRSRSSGVLLAALMLSACGGGQERVGRRAPGYRPVADLPVRIGAPYTVRGRTYVPADDRGYDAVGLASWYGSESGSRTANGERFRPDWIGAAHRTLPLPSYVEVTALRTGRTILVRVNDRGPFADGRVIDLSRGAARLLGTERDGTVPVRVRRVYPPEADRAALRGGRPATARATVPVATLAGWPARASGPAPVRTTRPPSVPARLYVVVATLSEVWLADAVAHEVGGSVIPGDGRFQVRIGPVDGDAAAQGILARVRAGGYQDARLVRDPATIPPFMDTAR